MPGTPGLGVLWSGSPGLATSLGVDRHVGKGVVGEIFISYASADAARAGIVAEWLRWAGHRIFRDSDRADGVAPGAEWQKALFRELRLCDAVVFLNSGASQASMWCHTELAVATELGRRVYSLDLAPGLAPHPLLRSLQGIRFETTIEAGIERLTANLSLDGLARGISFRWDRGRAPYPGLAAMDVADAGVSDRLTDAECRDRLLSQGAGVVGEWLADHAESEARRVLITVDQAEQLATFTAPQEAGEFLAVLGKGLGAGSPVTVVMTVRS